MKFCQTLRRFLDSKLRATALANTRYVKRSTGLGFQGKFRFLAEKWNEVLPNFLGFWRAKSLQKLSSKQNRVILRTKACHFIH